MSSLISLVKKLFYIPRCLAGPGNRKTLSIINNYLYNNLELKYFLSGKKINSWTIPKEWHVIKGEVIGPDKKKYVDYSRNNLEVVTFSDSFSGILNLKKFKKKIHTIKELPSAIPYVTNYYSNNYWGFCMQYSKFKSLPEGEYKIDLKTKKISGKMDYGELFIEGKSKKEIIFSTYICHPQMANNELSGPAVLTYLIKNIYEYKKRNKLNFSYRFLFLPETIGTISYINKNYKKLKSNFFAGYIITCVGTEHNFNFIPSHLELSLSDMIACQVLKNSKFKWRKRSFLERGSDERQWCSPGVNLPFCSIVSSKYQEYKFYHTSLDNLNFISEKGLKKSLKIYFNIFKKFEESKFYYNDNKGEPMLSKYGLSPKISNKNSKDKKSFLTQDVLNVLAYCNGNNNLDSLAEKCNLREEKVLNIIKKLKKHKLIKQIF
jgi:aminopeptidase-like protein